MKELPHFPPIKYDLETRFGTIYDEDEKRAIEEVLKRDAPTSNIKTLEFEKKFAEMVGTKYAITVSNGTAALQMAFKAINISPGDEVITTPITWIATAAAAATFGATIKFADIDPSTFNIDPHGIESLITPRTKAICPVHLYGQPVDMDPIMEIAEKYNLYVIEDSAHAPGGKYHQKMTGAIGDLGCFSFHEQKNLSTLGEGGMITTNDPVLYERARLYKSHCARVVGRSTKYLQLPEEKRKEVLEKDMYWYQDFDDLGFNFRMNDITAAVGICQLKKLPRLNELRNRIAEKYDKMLEDFESISPLKVIPDIYHTYHLYPVKLDLSKLSKKGLTREKLIYRLRMEFGIKVGVHYMPLVLTEAFKSRGYSEKDAPIAVKEWPSLITLPIHPRLSDEGISYLYDSLRSLLS